MDGHVRSATTRCGLRTLRLLVALAAMTVIMGSVINNRTAATVASGLPIAPSLLPGPLTVSLPQLFKHHPRNPTSRGAVSSSGLLCLRRLTGGTRCRAARSQDGESAFFADDGVSFPKLGISAVVSDALARAGWTRPSRTQEAGMPHIVQGEDVVLAAETGSGKTLTYLAPIISQLYTQGFPFVDRDSYWAPAAMVLCPSVALCQQVVAVANSIQTEAGRPLCRAGIVSQSRPPPPSSSLHIVVSTPAGIMNMLREGEGLHGWEWTLEGLPLRIRHLVVDEADLILTGSYLRDLNHLLEVLKVADRSYVARRMAPQLGMTPEEFEQLQRHQKLALYREGLQGLADQSHKAATAALDRQRQAALDRAASPSTADGGADAEALRLDGWEPWSWAYFPDQEHRSRQRIFCAATMPTGGTKSVAQDLSKLVPDAVWVSGNMLHQSLDHIQHRWVQVEEGDWAEALVAAVQEDPDFRRGQGSTLVFTQDVTAASATAHMLQEAGLKPLLYHKKVAVQDREESLRQLARSEAAVMVCTDFAARGLDIPNVTHVIQADFASSAIDFLHRVGRTGRAGGSGRVTSLYRQDSAVLAEALWDAVEKGQPVEGAFSRNRSFRKKVKKFGGYIPRSSGAVELPGKGRSRKSEGPRRYKRS